MLAIMAATQYLPPIETVQSLSTSDRANILDLLFEPCTQLHTLSLELLRISTFLTYDELVATVGVQLTDLADSTSTSDKHWLDAILGAHPRLGEKKVDSEQSRTEQAQLNVGNAEELQRLTNLNEEYEQSFPGLRYV